MFTVFKPSAKTTHGWILPSITIKTQALKLGTRPASVGATLIVMDEVKSRLLERIGDVPVVEISGNQVVPDQY
jgi:hypothetical protein